jgi:DNA-directed RNA polymerase subunit beta'
MRTFHSGGAAQISEQSFVESNFEGAIKIKNLNVARNSDGDLIAMSRNLIIAVLDPDGTERAVHRIPYGARLKVNDGEHIKRGQRMAEWDPYTRPILTEVEGSLAFEDLVEGQSMTETLDESTGIAKRVVIDWRSGSVRGQQDLRPALVIKGKDGKILKLSRGGDARSLLAVDAIISVDPDGQVKAGDVIARIPTESAKTRDITGGLPRVAELFEARRPKESAVIAEISGTVRFGRDYKNKRRITIEPASKDEAEEYRSQGQAHPPAGRRHHREGLHRRLQPGAATSWRSRASRSCRLPRQRDPGRLPAAGRGDQRQAHRSDRPPDAAEGRDRRPGETDLIQGEQVDKIEFDEVTPAQRRKARSRRPRIRCCLASPRPRCRPVRSSPRLRSRRRRASYRGGGQRQGRHA